MHNKGKLLFFFIFILSISSVYIFQKYFRVRKNTNTVKKEYFAQDIYSDISSPLKIDDYAVIFGKMVLATVDDQPHLFFDDYKGNEVGKFYTYSYVDDLLNSGGAGGMFGLTPVTQFVRIDKMQRHMNVNAYEASIFYEPQSQAIVYIRGLRVLGYIN